MASPNISELIATTLSNRTGETEDNVSNNNALLFQMKKKGRIKPIDGGTEILQELEYAANTSVKRYSGFDDLDLTIQDVISAAKFDIKQMAVSVQISGLEELMNAGKERIIDLLDTRIDNAIHSMENQIATDLYSDGTADGGKQITGLQAAVPDIVTSGTYGAIDRAIWTFWRPTVIDASVIGAGAVDKTTIQHYFHLGFAAGVRGTDKTTMIIVDNNYWTFYMESLTPMQQLVDKELGNAGFTNIAYMGNIPVVLDGGVGGGCPADHAYMLNAKYLYWRPHRNRNMDPLPKRAPLQQDATVQYIGWAGNLTCSNARLQSVVHA